MIEEPGWDGSLFSLLLFRRRPNVDFCQAQIQAKPACQRELIRGTSDRSLKPLSHSRRKQNKLLHNTILCSLSGPELTDACRPPSDSGLTTLSALYITM